MLEPAEGGGRLQNTRHTCNLDDTERGPEEDNVVRNKAAKFPDQRLASGTGTEGEAMQVCTSSEKHSVSRLYLSAP